MATVAYGKVRKEETPRECRQRVVAHGKLRICFDTSFLVLRLVACRASFVANHRAVPDWRSAAARTATGMRLKVRLETPGNLS